MAALLDRFDLDRHALPVRTAIDVVRELDRRAASRPRLVATWQTGADGRVVCAWAACSAAAGGFTLDVSSG
jgi:5-hydroxyisourate hydrolase-like protein (transthyretin family)